MPEIMPPPRDHDETTTGSPREPTVNPQGPLVVPAPTEIIPTTGHITDIPIRADGCPKCVANVVYPYRVAIEDHGLTAYYHCRPCAHHWYTGWGE